MNDVFNRLKAPFPPDRISWRVGSTTQDKKKGLAFGYIDARDVMERLDDVCGPENWQCSYPHANGKTICSIGIRVARDGGGFEWVYKADGAGDSDVEAEKGAMSDAFKRAAVRFGIGRYLYDIPATWVEIEAAGRSFKIAEKEYSKLENILRRGAPVVVTRPSVATGADDPKEMFIATCSEIIKVSGDPVALREWWSSHDQKKQRRDFELSKPEVEGLISLLKSRLETLENKKAA